jgi:hypothetical protein
MDKRKLGLLGLWWGWLPALYGLVWLVSHFLFGGMKFNQTIEQFMLANVWSGGGWLWLWLTVGFIGGSSLAGLCAVAEWETNSAINAAET